MDMCYCARHGTHGRGGSSLRTSGDGRPSVSLVDRIEELTMDICILDYMMKLMNHLPHEGTVLGVSQSYGFGSYQSSRKKS